MKANFLHHVSEEERMDIYDRLATKWALKVEAKLRKQQRTKSRDHRATN